LGGDKPYLLTGSDDATVKVWDYQHKSCVQTLEGHANNVSVVAFHAGLNLIISGSEDGTLRLWHSNTYRLEKTLNYGLERVWALNLLKGSNKLAIGYDEGTVLLKLASEAPAVSMDASGGKIIWARQNEIQGAVLRLPGAASASASVDGDAAEGGAAAAAAAPAATTTTIADGERVPVSSKELGTCEFSPAYLAHSHNGRFVVVCGDGECVFRFVSARSLTNPLPDTSSTPPSLGATRPLALPLSLFGARTLVSTRFVRQWER
jgi:coatomer subunit beta'